MTHDADRPAPWLPHALAWGASQAFAAVVDARNALFATVRAPRELIVHGKRIPVISVGNMSAGGTGKSPLVAWLCNELAQMNCKPVIAMRGYRSARGAGGTSQSDEALEYAASAPGALVVVDPHRHRALTARLARQDCAAWIDRAVVVLDDGFQHRQLARDLDIVLVDATRPALDGGLLPLGWLRERASNIARANVVVVTKAHSTELARSGGASVLRARGREADAVCAHAWTTLEHVAAGKSEVRSVEWMRGRAVVSACAVGNPAQFEGMIERSGARLVKRVHASDHMAFDAATLAAAIAQARAMDASVEALVMTRKDVVKLDRVPEFPLVVPQLAIEFHSGSERVREAVARVVSARGAPASASCCCNSCTDDR